MPARSGTSAARTRRRSTIAGRSRCPPAATRRIRWRGRPAPFRAIGPSVCTGATRARIRRSRTRARRSRSSTRASTTTTPDGAQAVVLRRRRRHRRHHAHRHRAVRHQQRHGDGLRQGELHEEGLPRGVLHQHPQRRRRQPADAATPEGKPIAFDFETRTYDFEASNVQTFRTSTSSATAATCASTRSTCRIAPNADNRTESAATCRTRSSCRTMFRLVAGARVDRFDYLERLRVLAAHDVHDQADARTRRSASRTTAPTARRRSSTTSSIVMIAQPINLGAVQPGAGRAASTRCRCSRSGNPDLQGAVARRLRDRLHRRRREARDRVGGVLRQQRQERHLLHAGPIGRLHAARIRRPAGRCRRPCIGLRPWRAAFRRASPT